MSVSAIDLLKQADELHRNYNFEKAIEYYNNAISRQTIRNFNPYDTEPYYSRALCNFFKSFFAFIIHPQPSIL